jgi:hypothetical protein
MEIKPELVKVLRGFTPLAPKRSAQALFDAMGITLVPLEQFRCEEIPLGGWDKCRLQETYITTSLDGYFIRRLCNCPASELLNLGCRCGGA